MQLARVIGDVVATRKDANLAGITLLVLQPLGADRRAGGPHARGRRCGRRGRRRSTCSSCAARRRRSRSIPPSRRPTPAIVGIVDHWDMEDDATKG